MIPKAVAHTVTLSRPRSEQLTSRQYSARRYAPATDGVEPDTQDLIAIGARSVQFGAVGGIEEREDLEIEDEWNVGHQWYGAGGGGARSVVGNVHRSFTTAVL